MRRVSEEKTHSNASQIIAYPSLLPCMVPAGSFPALVAVSLTKREDRLIEMYITGVPRQVYPHTWWSEEG